MKYFKRGKNLIDDGKRALSEKNNFKQTILF